MPQLDLLVRNGTVVDGTGRPLAIADVAVADGRIQEVGAVDAGAAIEIDATGLLVTPGFIDSHSHFDGHVTWENRLKPDSGHGITTTVIGNCGVGFAPCRREDRPFAVALMEGVEDIPAEVLEVGLPWRWESYGEFLAFLSGRTYDMNVAGYLPHSMLRLYAMGERALNGDPATADDISLMADLTREAIDAGAVGVASTRLDAQRTLSGISAPSVHADEAELLGIARALEQAGRGLLQVAPEFNQFPQAEHELAMMIRIARETGITVTYSLKQTNRYPDGWRTLLDMTERANEDGVDLRPQVLARPTGAIVSWECSLHPFAKAPSYRSIAALPLSERLEALGDRARRDAIIGESAGHRGRLSSMYRQMFPITDVIDYEPTADRSVTATAAEIAADPEAVVYDHMMANGGRGMLLLTGGNYAQGTLEPALEMMRFPTAVPGLGDGGAHSTIVCDASAPTHLLSYWVRDRAVGDRLAIEAVVKKLTFDLATLFGFTDRGSIAPGKAADLNLIDLDALDLEPPRMEYDLPAGGKRLVQDASGYAAIVVNGVPVYRNGVPTGYLPGRLL